jgi:hypothetical protein
MDPGTPDWEVLLQYVSAGRGIYLSANESLLNLHPDPSISSTLSSLGYEEQGPCIWRHPSGHGILFCATLQIGLPWVHLLVVSAILEGRDILLTSPCHPPSQIGLKDIPRGTLTRRLCFALLWSVQNNASLLSVQARGELVVCPDIAAPTMGYSTSLLMGGLRELGWVPLPCRRRPCSLDKCRSPGYVHIIGDGVRMTSKRCLENLMWGVIFIGMSPQWMPLLRRVLSADRLWNHELPSLLGVL